MTVAVMYYFGLGLHYWIIIGITGLLSLGAAALVRGTFARYSHEQTRSRMTGADVARQILRDNGINDVEVERVAGHLSDHYDPRSKTLRLSEPVFDKSTMASFGVAAHEVGHAIQHAQGYAPLGFRSMMVPLTNFGSQVSFIVLFIAVLLGGATQGPGSMGYYASWAGVLLFGTSTLFTLITLPVEFDASKRALIALEHGGYTTRDELVGARKVLRAAALTYVAAFISSALMLLYWAWRLGLIGGRRR